MYTQDKGCEQLTQEERSHIEIVRYEKYSMRSIANTIGRNVATISREFRRNRRSDKSYTATYAQKQTNKRRSYAKQKYRKIENDPELATRIETKLRGDHDSGDWSPEVIANTTLKGKVSHKTIYAWIKRSRRDLIKVLPYQGKRRARYGSVATRTYREMSLPSIALRPSSVETREEIGYFEGDTVILKGGRIHTLVERKSRFLIADGIPHLGPGLAMQVSDSAIATLKHLPVSHRKTITYDQGSAFAWWDQTEQKLPNTKIYFAHAHHPWERGTNEKTNGLVRRYFPTVTTFTTLTYRDVAKAMHRLNHRPRKILLWKTPCEVFGCCCSSD